MISSLFTASSPQLRRSTVIAKGSNTSNVYTVQYYTYKLVADLSLVDIINVFEVYFLSCPVFDFHKQYIDDVIEKAKSMDA